MRLGTALKGSGQDERGLLAPIPVRSSSTCAVPQGEHDDTIRSNIGSHVA